jgi:hypothetical protein
VVKRELPKLLIHLVINIFCGWLPFSDPIGTDCPEREATYIITNGGINDPDKA